jgi:glycine cleavage system transcriptional repressor
VFYSQVPLEEAHLLAKEPSDHFKMTTSGIDHAGIVSRVCRLLADQGVNIVDMKTRRILSTETGTPLFEMEIDLDIPRSVSEFSLRKDLHGLANELLIDLVLRKGT